MEDYQKIRRMFLVEHMSQRQIAKEMGISRNTVAKYCGGDTYPGQRNPYRRNASVMTEDVLAFIQGCFQEDAQEPNRKQHHTAHRIYTRLVSERGFTGAESTVRRVVRELRGNLQEAFVPLAFDPGDSMQIDWGEAYVCIKGVRTKLNCFCARLCYSCAPFAICFHHQNTEAFLEGLQKAFEYFGGVPRRVVFDNARIAVKKGSGKNAVAQESYRAMAAHYCFETVFCNVRKGNEKGLVENLVGLTRRNVFVPVPHAESLAEINRILLERCESYAATRKIDGRPESVSAMLAADRQHFLPLPGIPYDPSRASVCRVSPYATVRFDANAYSVPVLFVGREVTVRAFAEIIRIFADGKEIASHARCYKRGQKLLTLSHYLPLLARKPRSIFYAQPVQQNVSDALLHVLRTTDFDGKELMEILTLVAEEGEDAFWKREPEFLVNHAKTPAIPDAVEVQRVNLSVYDQMLEEGEDPCRMQA